MQYVKLQIRPTLLNKKAFNDIFSQVPNTSGVAGEQVGARVPGRRSWGRINTLYSAI